MTRLAFAFLLCITAAISAMAWSAGTFHTVNKSNDNDFYKAQNGPRPVAEGEVQFEKVEIDLGNINAPATAEFQYENTGNRAVRDIEIQSSCACHISNPVGTRLEQGQFGTLKVEIDPHRKPPGFQSTSIDFVYLGQARRSVRLTIFYTREVDLVAPKQLPIYCSTSETNFSIFVVTFFSRVRPDIIRTSSSSDRLMVMVEESPSRINSGWDFRFRLEFDGLGMPPGDYDETVTIFSTSDRHPTIKIPARIQVRPRIRVSPSQLRLSQQDGNQPILGKVFIDDTKGESLVFDSWFADNPDLSVEKTTIDDTRLLLTIRLRAGAILEKECHVTVKFMKPEERAVQIRVTP